MLSFYRTTLRYQASCYYPSSNGVSELIQHHSIAQIVEVPTATQPTIILRVKFAINCDYAITWFTIPLALIYQTNSMLPSIEQRLATELAVKFSQIQATIQLLDDGATVPFIARYRKEATGGLDDAQLRAEKFRLNESRGVLISKVDAGSLAQAEGLREGDLIKEVNRVETGTVGEFTIAVAKVKRGDTILLRVLREGGAFYVVLKPADH